MNVSCSLLVNLSQLVQLDDDRMRRINFHRLVVRHLLKLSTDLSGVYVSRVLCLHHGHHMTHTRRNLSKEHHWHVLQPSRKRDFGDIGLAVLLEPNHKGRDVLLRNGLHILIDILLGSLLSQVLLNFIERGRLDVDERLRFVVANLVEDHLVELLGDQEHRDITVFERCDEWAFHGSLEVSCRNIVNLRLFLLHLCHIVFQRTRVAFTANESLVAHKSK